MNNTALVPTRGEDLMFLPVMMGLSLESFRKNALKQGADECWGWRLSKQKAGYGQVRIKGQTHLAHRVSYLANKGPIPSGMEVCHKCDNPECVNPNHLVLGTHAYNLADMGKKGRSPRGEKHWHARLTKRQIEEIRSLARQGYTYQKIGRLFGISRHHASDIARGKAWAHIE